MHWPRLTPALIIVLTATWFWYSRQKSSGILLQLPGF
jgi:hypothetical protein